MESLDYTKTKQALASMGYFHTGHKTNNHFHEFEHKDGHRVYLHKGGHVWQHHAKDGKDTETHPAEEMGSGWHELSTHLQKVHGSSQHAESGGGMEDTLKSYGYTPSSHTKGLHSKFGHKVILNENGRDWVHYLAHDVLGKKDTQWKVTKGSGPVGLATHLLETHTKSKLSMPQITPPSQHAEQEENQLPEPKGSPHIAGRPRHLGGLLPMREPAKTSQHSEEGHEAILAKHGYFSSGRRMSTASSLRSFIGGYGMDSIYKHPDGHKVTVFSDGEWHHHHQKTKRSGNGIGHEELAEHLKNIHGT